jgi:hypothetical protein
LTVEQADPQSGLRKFQRDGSTDQSTARNGHIELLHPAILAQPGAAFMP